MVFVIGSLSYQRTGRPQSHIYLLAKRVPSARAPTRINNSLARHGVGKYGRRTNTPLARVLNLSRRWQRLRRQPTIASPVSNGHRQFSGRPRGLFHAPQSGRTDISRAIEANKGEFFRKLPSLCRILSSPRQIHPVTQDWIVHVSWIDRRAFGENLCIFNRTCTPRVQIEHEK